MKKKLSILIALVMAISLCLIPAVAVSGASMPKIDGVLEDGEWDGALELTVVSDMGTVSIIANTVYLFVLFDLADSTDARLGQNLKGNDQISINVNPTDGGAWGFPYDLIFETSADFPWNPKVNSGTLDGWNTRWFPDNAQQSLPSNLESATLYSGGRRITEWKLPLASSLGDTLLVGGAIEVGDGNSYVYPIGLNWSEAKTFATYELPPAPERSPDAFDVFVRFGYDSTRYDPNGALISSIEAMGEYNATRYMLEIPKDCVVTGKAGRINWLWLAGIDGAVLSFVGGDASFSEPCTLYITDGGRLYQDYWTGEWLGEGKWVEVGSFTAIKDGEAHLD